jgi:uncharacterized protein YjbI with pentapeptide repeats
LGDSDVAAVAPHQQAEDERLERRYKRSQVFAAWAQLGAMVAALSTAAVAFYVAHQGQITINRDAQAALQQSEEEQLSTAITALGSNSTSDRVAGLLLLARNAAGRFTLAAKTGEGRAQLWDDYTTALQTFSAYLSSQSSALLASAVVNQPGAPFGRGYGTELAPSPIDLQYAVNQVEFLLGPRLQREVMSEREGAPSLDLSNDELSGANFTGARFGWIHAYMPAIDLRGATLRFSDWSSKSDLSGAYLQCANLLHSDFGGANLSHADLSGADVEGADFTRADLRGATITYVYGIAKWPAEFGSVTVLPVREWNTKTCMADPGLWQNTPAVSNPSQPAPNHSP